jgi:hypothetical protein
VILSAVVLSATLIVGVLIFELSNMSNVENTSYGPGPVDIEVVADKLFYVQGEEVNFTIYVNNPQNWSVPEPSVVTHEMNRAGSFVFGGTVCIDFAAGRVPTFPAHSRTLYETRVWDGKVGSGDNRTLAPPGTYTYTVTVGGIVDYGSGGNCTFEVRAKPES